MQELRDRAKQDNPSPRSESTTPSTLATYLLLYSKADRECYIEYMRGAKDLLAWLTNNGSVPLDLQLDKYPRMEDPNFQVPSLLGGYESGELARILVGEGAPLTEVARMRNLIYLTMSSGVMYGLY